MIKCTHAKDCSKNSSINSVIVGKKVYQEMFDTPHDSFNKILEVKSGELKDELSIKSVQKSDDVSKVDIHKGKNLSNEDFWSAIMQSEGRDFAYKLLQEKFGSEDGLKVKLSSGREILLSGEVGPQDFGIISSLWNKYR